MIITSFRIHFGYPNNYARVIEIDFPISTVRWKINDFIRTLLFSNRPFTNRIWKKFLNHILLDWHWLSWPFHFHCFFHRSPPETESIGKVFPYRFEVPEDDGHQIWEVRREEGESFCTSEKPSVNGPWSWKLFSGKKIKWMRQHQGCCKFLIWNLLWFQKCRKFDKRSHYLKLHNL